MKTIIMHVSHPNQRLSRLLIGGLFVIWAMATLTTPSRAFVLVSPEEVARERLRGEPPRVRGSARGGDFGGPEIVLVNPHSLKNIPSPLDIELRFMPNPPSRIVRDSLRVLYGFFGTNITDRITKHAEVTPSGLLAKNAKLPAGSHSIPIEISDKRVTMNTVAGCTY